MDTEIQVRPELIGLKIGEFSIIRVDDKSIFIRHASGEGAQVREALLAEAIAKFYMEHF